MKYLFALLFWTFWYLFTGEPWILLFNKQNWRAFKLTENFRNVKQTSVVIYLFTSCLSQVELICDLTAISQLYKLFNALTIARLIHGMHLRETWNDNSNYVCLHQQLITSFLVHHAAFGGFTNNKLPARNNNQYVSKACVYVFPSDIRLEVNIFTHI